MCMSLCVTGWKHSAVHCAGGRAQRHRSSPLRSRQLLQRTERGEPVTHLTLTLTTKYTSGLNFVYCVCVFMCLNRQLLVTAASLFPLVVKISLSEATLNGSGRFWTALLFKPPVGKRILFTNLQSACYSPATTMHPSWSICITLHSVYYNVTQQVRHAW